MCMNYSSLGHTLYHKEIKKTLPQLVIFMLIYVLTILR